MNRNGPHSISSHGIGALPEKVSATAEELFAKYRQSKDPDIREDLVLRHIDLVRKLASRFANRGQPLDSLVSVGSIGLINAVDRYDVSRGVKFTTYATHCILGEIKRYFRNQGWVLKVPRRLKELNSIVHHTIDDLTTILGRSPIISEIARKLDISSETVIEVMEAGRSYKPYSLNQKPEFDDERSFSFLESLSQDDQELLSLFDKIDLREAIRTLNKREQMIVRLFYFEDYSQTEIAERLEISQMHVSRLLRQTIKSLKKILA